MSPQQEQPPREPTNAELLSAIAALPTREDVREAAEQVFRHYTSDPGFWIAGVEHMAAHAADTSARWVGRRLLTAFVAAVVSAGVVWLVKTGKGP